MKWNMWIILWFSTLGSMFTEVLFQEVLWSLSMMSVHCRAVDLAQVFCFRHYTWMPVFALLRTFCEVGASHSKDCWLWCMTKGGYPATNSSCGTHHDFIKLIQFLLAGLYFFCKIWAKRCHIHHNHFTGLHTLSVSLSGEVVTRLAMLFHSWWWPSCLCCVELILLTWIPMSIGNFRIKSWEHIWAKPNFALEIFLWCSFGYLDESATWLPPGLIVAESAQEDLL